MKTSVVLAFAPFSVAVGAAKKKSCCCYLAFFSVDQCGGMGQKELATAGFLRTVDVELVDGALLDGCSQVLLLEFRILLSGVP